MVIGMILEPVMRLFTDGGVVMIFIAAVSVGAWTLALHTWLKARKLLRWLTGGALRRQQAEFGAEPGQTKGFTSRENLLSAELVRIESAIESLSTLSNVLPLLGLFGTVFGMLLTFQALQQYGTAEPRQVADGIRQALLTTQSGLWVALPVLVFHDRIRACLAQLRVEMGLARHRSTWEVVPGRMIEKPGEGQVV